MGFRVHDQGIVTYEQNKLGLSAYYGKRYVLVDGIHARPYSYNILKILRKCAAASEHFWTQRMFMYFLLNYCDRNNHHIERLRIPIVVKNIPVLQSLSNKVAGLPAFSPATLWKRDSDTDVFLWILQNSQEHTEHLRMTASLVKVHRIISFKILSKIAVNRKEKGLARKKLRHRYFPWKLSRDLKVILDGVFQIFITTLAIKSLVSPQLSLLL